MSVIPKLREFVTNKDYRRFFLAKRGFYGELSDKDYISIVYKYEFGKDLDWENPKTFNEKLQWLKIYDRRPEYTTLVDKYRVRDFVAAKIGVEYLIPLLGVWDNPEDIDFTSLPNQFVLKCNHNSGLGMCICKDKSKLDIDATKRSLKKGLEENFYLVGREWPYKDVPRKIICEQYMTDGSSTMELESLTDYKFYCFDGKVKMFGVYTDRNTSESTKANYFDCSFKSLDFTWGYPKSKKRIRKPVCIDEMIEISETLAACIPEVRVDLYVCGGKVFFGELTFFDGSGFERFFPDFWDSFWGNEIALPSINKGRR